MSEVHPKGVYGAELSPWPQGGCNIAEWGRSVGPEPPCDM
jgi:hypothetical protein